MNTQVKHTPGPWIVDEVSEDEAGQETLGVYAEQGGYIAGIHCGPDTTIDEQDKANAHLIAAAPAMYAELVNGLGLLEASYHDMCDKYGKDSMQAEVVWDQVERTRNVIAQAEGR